MYILFDKARHSMTTTAQLKEFTSKLGALQAKRVSLDTRMIALTKMKRFTDAFCCMQASLLPNENGNWKIVGLTDGRDYIEIGRIQLFGSY